MLSEQSEDSIHKRMEDSQTNFHMVCKGTRTTMLNGPLEQSPAVHVPTVAGTHMAGLRNFAISSELPSHVTSYNSPDHPSKQLANFGLSGHC